jgi:hypothetical protein
MQEFAVLDKEGQAKRRTVADALELVRQKLGLDEITAGQFRIVPLQLPSSERTTCGCHVPRPGLRGLPAPLAALLSRHGFMRVASGVPPIMFLSAMEGMSHGS